MTNLGSILKSNHSVPVRAETQCTESVGIGPTASSAQLEVCLSFFLMPCMIASCPQVAKLRKSICPFCSEPCPAGWQLLLQALAPQAESWPLACVVLTPGTGGHSSSVQSWSSGPVRNAISRCLTGKNFVNGVFSKSGD